MSDGPETVTLDLSAPPTPAVQVAPVFTGAPGNLMADLAAIAAEQAPAPEVAAPVIEQAQPEITEPAPAPVTVPDKFKDAEGGIDEAKVSKSLMHGEAALQKALEVEKQLRRKQNEIAALRQGAPVPVPVTTVPSNVQMSPLEVQYAQDLIQSHAEQGLQLDPRSAAAMARVQVKLAEAKYAADVSLTESLRQRIEDQDRRRELEAIAKEDSFVFSPGGIEALAQIRENNPWVNQSPNPWQAAYDLHLANQTRQQRLKGTVQPTPTGPAAKAPPTPVGPAPRAVVQSQAPALETQDQINAYVKGLNPAQEAAFWKSRGLRF